MDQATPAGFQVEFLDNFANFALKEEPHPSSKLKLWLGPENLGALRCAPKDC